MGSAPQPRPSIRTPWPLALCPASLAARGHRAGWVVPGFALDAETTDRGRGCPGTFCSVQTAVSVTVTAASAVCVSSSIPFPSPGPHHASRPGSKSVFPKTGASVCLEDSGAAGCAQHVHSLWEHPELGRWKLIGMCYSRVHRALTVLDRGAPHLVRKESVTPLWLCRQ